MSKKYSILIALVLAGIIVIVALTNKDKAPSSSQKENGSLPASTENSLEPTGGTTPRPVTAPRGDNGRIIFGITDEAINLDEIQSVFITITKLQVHKDKSWTTVFNTPKKYDLLQLKKTASIGLIADSNLPVGSYTQIRLSLSDVSVVKNDGTASTARLPSSDLRIVSIAPIEKGAISSLIFDFDLEKSLIGTGNGEYIFAPVIKLSSMKNVFSAEYLPQNRVRLSGGTSPTTYSFGMNENGEVKENFYFDNLTNFEFIGNAIKVTPQNTDESGVKITPQKAIEIATGNGSVQSVLSIRLVRFDNQTKIWRMVGIQNTNLITVNINAETGAVLFP